MLIKSPKIILTEWIPFGKNYLTEFIDRITLKEYQSNRKRYFSISPTKNIKNEPFFSISKHVTTVKIIDFEPENYIKLISTLVIDNIDMFIYADYLGRCIYALEVEESEIKKLSFIIPNLIIKSSRVMYPLLSSSQRYLLEVLYGRLKVYKHVTVVSETEIKDKEDILKLSQIVGSIKRVIKLSEGSIIFGDFGIYISTKTPKKFEKFIYCYTFIRSLTGVSRDLFFKLNSISSKLEIISDSIKNLDYDNIDEIRGELSIIDKEMSVIEIVIGYLEEIIEIVEKHNNCVDDEFTNNILDLLDVDKKIKRIQYRIREIKTLLDSNEKLATSLTRLLTTISEDLERDIAKQLAENTKYQVALGEAMEVLEIGIFGIYALEAVHVLITASKKEIFYELYILGLPLKFWIILISIFLGLYLGKIIIESRKKAILES
ncbi:hypothetical protein ACPB8Q_07810 [Methanocaldococcus indicus]|uniref:hypothetical protein n=1 Tax=Methanocaldococcus indicus TaxID=213231 RepID=UPI003C6DA563